MMDIQYFIAPDLVHTRPPGRETLPADASSGRTFCEVARRFAGVNMAGFIEKPYTRAALIRVLRRVLESSDKR